MIDASSPRGSLEQALWSRAREAATTLGRAGAAVVLGGTSLMGGRGSVTGSLIGAFVIGVLADGLVMLGVSEFWRLAGVYPVQALDLLRATTESLPGASRVGVAISAQSLQA